MYYTRLHCSYVFDLYEELDLVCYLLESTSITTPEDRYGHVYELKNGGKATHTYSKDYSDSSRPNNSRRRLFCVYRSVAVARRASSLILSALRFNAFALTSFR